MFILSYGSLKKKKKALLSLLSIKLTCFKDSVTAISTLTELCSLWHSGT